MSFQALQASPDVTSVSSKWDGRKYTVSAAKGDKVVTATGATEDEAAAKVTGDLLTDKQAEKAQQAAGQQPEQAEQPEKAKQAAKK